MNFGDYYATLKFYIGFGMIDYYWCRADFQSGISSFFRSL